MTKKIISVGGENLIDFVETGEVNGIPQYSAIVGGGPFNIAIAAARQGATVNYLTPVSRDRLGKMIASHLDDSGVNLTAPVLAAPTSLAVVSLENGQPSYQFYREGTAERMVSTTMLKAQTRNFTWAFHVGSLALSGGDDADAWEEHFIACHDNGVITSLDPNVRPALIPDRESYIERIERMSQYAKIIKLSDEDIGWLYPGRSAEQAFDQMAEHAGDTLMVMTMGKNGSIGRSASGSVHCPASSVENMVDTVGAGDTFMASMLVWLEKNGICSCDDVVSLGEANMLDMLGRASRAAALNCEKQGCNPPNEEELIDDDRP